VLNVSPTAGQILILLSAFIGVGIALRYAWRVRRRDRLRRRPLSRAWLAIVESNLPVYRKMPADLQAQIQGLMQVFLDEKRFLGAGGLEITDEMRVTVAAQACLLLLNRRTRVYPNLYTIFMYPSAYRTAQEATAQDGTVAKPSQTRLGESWTRGPVVLAWDHSKKGGRNFRDGRNVVIHEFAHQLDQADGVADGTPVLEKSGRYRSWAAVLGREYEQLRGRAGRQHRRAVLDDYGATNEAEFFAVASESFFEKPRQMMDKHPDLFDELKTYYQIDPSEWV